MPMELLSSPLAHHSSRYLQLQALRFVSQLGREAEALSFQSPVAAPEKKSPAQASDPLAPTVQPCPLRRP